MISAAGIKDQELTIIVSMMLIELALLRLSRFPFTLEPFQVALLDTQGLELLVALHPRVWWARRAEYSEFRNPSVSGSPLEAEDAEKGGTGARASNPSGRGVGWRREREQDHRIAVSHDDFSRDVLASSPKARIRLDSRKSVRSFKGIICVDISEFESYMPSHAVGSLCAHDAAVAQTAGPEGDRAFACRRLNRNDRFILGAGLLLYSTRNRDDFCPRNAGRSRRKEVANSIHVEHGGHQRRAVARTGSQ